MGWQHLSEPKAETTETIHMTDTPKSILAKLNDAANRMAVDASTAYFEQVANSAASIIRKAGRGRRIILQPAEPNAEPICIDTSLMTVAYISRTHDNIRFTTAVHIPLITVEAINHYFIDYLEKVARKLK